MQVQNIESYALLNQQPCLTGVPTRTLSPACMNALLFLLGITVWQMTGEISAYHVIDPGSVQSSDSMLHLIPRCLRPSSVALKAD